MPVSSGPVAYLADLTSFSFENIKTSASDFLNSSWLSTNLHRDFTQLPANCDSLENQVCQARIATEVLRVRSMAAGVTVNMARLTILEKQYLEETYRTILNKLGTSYEELLSIQSASDPEAKQRYANRIGLVLDISGTPDTINVIFKNLSATPFPLSEDFLATNFGLPDSTTTTAPGLSKIEEWKALRLRQVWKERDYIDTPYHNGTAVIIDPDVVTVDDFRFPKDDSNRKAFQVWKARRKFVDTEVYQVLLTLATNGARIDRMKSTATGNKFVYTKAGTSSTNQIGGIWPSYAILETNGNSLQRLLGAVNSGSSAAADTLWSTYLLKTAELTRFMDLYNKELASIQLTISEVIESINILTQVVKRAFKTIWLAEENAPIGGSRIELSSKEFWISEREPKEGKWPILNSTPDPLLIPIIDPEFISTAGLPELTYQKNGYDAKTNKYLIREGELTTAKNNLLALTTYAFKINNAFNSTGYNYNGATNSFVSLAEQLDDPTSADNARTEITEVLKLTIEDFVYLVTLGEKYYTDETSITEPEWERFYGIATTARKVHTLYSSWLTADINQSTIKYWQLRKANLPKWRASTQEREEWKSAYREHNRRPLIDPDLIGPAYLVNPIQGNEAFDLWKARFNNNIAKYNAIATAINSGSSTFNSVFEDYLFDDSVVTISMLETRKAEGEDIGKALEQLQVERTDYNFLVKVNNAAANPSALESEEKERMARILQKVQKRRLSYQYRKNEEADNITQSPDFFLARNDDYSTYPPTVPYELNPYLASSQDLNNWRRIVSSRIKEELEMKRGYSQLLFDVDDENIGFLRDALIDTTYSGDVVPGSPSEGAIGLSEKARRLGDKLLIDLQDNCCTKTNRIAQAIESMQQLLWKSNTGDILSDYPAIALVTPSFDTVWTWMGSYANWRASMFVFLYPENILLPSLKANATPIFKEIIRDTQNDRRFNPYSACKVAEEYREYLKDIQTLELKSTVQADVMTQKADDCAGASYMTENWTFVFATASNSGKSYFTTVRKAEDELDQRTLWSCIPNLPENAIIKGSDIFISKSRQINHIYVFYILNVFDEHDKFHALRFDLTSNSWEATPLKFVVTKDELAIIISGENSWHDHPKGEELLENLKLEISNIVVCENNYNWEPPFLAISLLSNYGVRNDDKMVEKNANLVFTRRLDGSGETFTSGAAKDTLWACTLWKDFGKNAINLVPGRDFNQGLIERMVHVQGEVEEYRQKNELGEIPWWRASQFYILKSTGLSLMNRKSSGQIQIIPILYTSLDKSASRTIFPISTNENLIWLKSTTSLPQAHYQYIDLDETINEDKVFELDFPMTIAHFNPLQLYSSSTPFAYQKINDPGSRIFITKASFDLAQLELHLDDVPLGLNPKFNEIPSFDTSITKSQRTILKEQTQINLEANINFGNPKLRIYPEEAYYNLPMHIGLKLSANGYYQEALNWFRLIYDYYAPETDRKVYYGLILEESFDALEDRLAEWYEDPLNPHAIANTRKNAHTRFVILSIANCLFSFANGEFSIDNSESVPRARELYEDMIDLLAVLNTDDPCAKDELIQSLDSYLDDDLVWRFRWNEIKRRLYDVSLVPSAFKTLITNVQGQLSGATANETKFETVQTLIDTAISNSTTNDTIETKLNNYEAQVVDQIGLSMVGNSKDSLFKKGSEVAQRNTTSVLTSITGYAESELSGADLGWVKGDAVPAGGISRSVDSEVDFVGNTKRHTINQFFWSKPKEAMVVNNPFPEIKISGMPFLFCVVPNPYVKAYKMAAAANLYKIHNCMNIAGMKRELNPFAAPTDTTTGIPSIGIGGVLQLPGQLSIPPSNFRYQFLVERAKQLVSIAQQMESSLLQSLERFDSETYSQFKAKQDIELAKSNIKLQDLKIKEAQSNLGLAELQKDRATIQVSGLQGMIDEGLLSFESELVNSFNLQAQLQIGLSLAAYVTKITNAAVLVAGAGGGPNVALSVVAATAAASVYSVAALAETSLQSELANIGSNISINQIYASLQRRTQEWEYQKTIANQDVKIGGQQVKIANDRIRITSQEREIADIQLNQAEATLDFLKTKFTNAELYEWMSGILEDIYAYFLQEATAMAKLAEQQLAFERQISLPNLIKSDYWVQEANNTMDIAGGSSDVDRKGLTGSARLLKDVTQLEQYHIDTTQRKLQLSKTISLAELEPVQMEQFRNSGVLDFYTTNRDFDRDFPGHYMRLIKRVSVSVIALTPPSKGIKATLLNGGISTVVTGGLIFQSKTIARNPERIALSSPYNDTGLLQFENDDRLLRPFEGSGVATNWELRMEKPSNDFDFRSIADVLLTIEYEALHDELYSQTIKGQLDSEPRGRSIVLSLKNNLPDTWFDLLNTEDESLGINSSFDIRESDLAPHVNFGLYHQSSNLHVARFG